MNIERGLLNSQLRPLPTTKLVAAATRARMEKIVEELEVRTKRDVHQHQRTHWRAVRGRAALPFGQFG
jgi:hypothetical protein